MNSLLIQIFYYLVISFSIIGYGNLSSKVMGAKLSLSELGFNGLLLMIILSYLTNFLTPHGYTHNLIILIIGLTFFLKL